ncbi:3-oxoacyl-[acyl-carrier-protein] synthase III C-terminal domain-containing protein [Streptomyces sp. NPDC049577]|uniref:3-oxoacyl-ACP synthase III family protein n=1 Tax=Streptomyces sp. NPDC049577 TaxID=3155153 RepID=UPI003432E485
MQPPFRARLAGIAVTLPARYRTVEQTREGIAAAGSRFVPPPGMLEDLLGVRGVHVRDEGEQASDLAAAAAVKALAGAGTTAGDVDLLLFASGSQDMIEPATAHIVAAKLGARCPVFDVRNACNSLLDALDVAALFIETGRHRSVLVTCGETLTMTTRWHVPDQQAFLRALPGYALSDAGAALLLTAGPAGEHDPGLLTVVTGADSTAWEACTVAAGGSRHFRPADDEPTYMRLGDDAMRDAVLQLAPRALAGAHRELGQARTSAFMALQQATLRQFEEVRDALGLPADRTLPVVAEHGNTASASLPLQLVRAIESDRVEPGDLVALFGMGSGLSAGLALLRL